MTPYTKKLHQCLIDTGKSVENKLPYGAPSTEELQELFDDFIYEVDSGDMKDQSIASEKLIVALVKWRVEKM